MENNSRQMTDDSCVSMYFSFNSTATTSSASKVTEGMQDISIVSFIEDDVDENTSDSQQNKTLEAIMDSSHSNTVLKTPIEEMDTYQAMPKNSIKKNILQECNVVSSTPTKAQLIRSVQLSRGSSDVCEEGNLFLEVPQEKNNWFSDENKENNAESDLSILSGSTERISSVIEKKLTQSFQKNIDLGQDSRIECKKTEKKLRFSNLPVRASHQSEIAYNNSATLKHASKKLLKPCEPNLRANRPSRIEVGKNSKTTTTDAVKISSKRFSTQSIEVSNVQNDRVEENRRQRKSSRMSLVANMPFSCTRRMSVLIKTTLNSPARKIANKSIVKGLGVPSLHKSKQRKSLLPRTYTGVESATNLGAATTILRKSILKGPAAPPNNQNKQRKSILPRTHWAVIECADNFLAPSSSRKSMIPTEIKAKTTIKTSVPSSCNKMLSVDPLKGTLRKSILPKSEMLSNPKNTGITDEFLCMICARKFSIKSLFDAHTRFHEDNKRKTSAPPAVRYSFVPSNDKQCKFCDKKFAINKALNNHLIQNCTKIPPEQRKKLLISETSALTALNPHSLAAAPPKLPNKNLSNTSCQSSSTESLSNRPRSTQVESSRYAENAMGPPTNNKVKKKLAHSGVYRTPNKIIQCHTCKLHFNNILAYTEHSMLHSNTKAKNTDTRAESSATQTELEVKINNSTQTSHCDDIKRNQ